MTAFSVVVLMLPDTPHVKEVVLGEQGLLKTLPRGGLIIDMSTIAPGAEKEIGETLATAGIAFVDAPVSGGVVGAVNGTLSIMVGGSVEGFERALPILQCMGKTIIHAGPHGSGQV